MDPVASFSGLSSGLDTKELVAQLIAVERRPLARLEAQVKDLGTRRAAWVSYRDALQKLRDAAAALSGGTALARTTASVQGTAPGGAPVLSATGGTGATPGTYAVQVNRLATAGTIRTRAFTSASAALGLSGDFTINGQTVTIAATDSLDAIRDRINALNTGATPTRVSATVIDTGSGFVLSARAADTGAAAFEAVDGAGSVLSDVAALGATVTDGVDAEFVVDGVTVTRASNSVGDVIPGVTLSLLAAAPGTPVQVTVGRDTEAARAAAQAFVTAYNEFIDFVARQAPVPNAATQPPLARETMLASAQRRFVGALQGALGTNPEGVRRLSEVGITVERSGKLALDAGALDAALATDPAALRALLADRVGAVEAAAAEQVRGVTGTIARRLKSLDERVARLETRVEEGDARLELRRRALTRRFVTMESALARLNNLTSAVGAQLARLAAGGS